ncbi:RcnB family protein [Pseudomonas sp.]|uniref:RcnB family protein n=1 Tax=Pseudomonas sp. TaxID=306 RepID=UPI0028ACE7E4|nr:RcnB family protein [Pseudomonas sp.]
MKKNLTVLCTLLMLGTPLAGFAQPGGGPDNRDGGPQGGQPQGQQGRPQPQGHQAGQPPGQSPQQRPQQPGNANRHGGGQPAYRDPGFRPQAGMPVPHQQWQRGHVVEPQYRDDRYWVTDWRARQLSAPPPEHRWLRVNGDYVLVAIATGVITSILTGY